MHKEPEPEPLRDPLMNSRCAAPYPHDPAGAGGRAERGGLTAERRGL